MRGFKPLVASLAVIALSLIALGAWSLSRDSRRPAHSPADDRPVTPGVPGGGLKYEAVEMEPRPEFDPADLWPNFGDRISSPDLWVLWKTAEFSECRLLCTSDHRSWYDLGRTAGRTHYLPADFAFFDGHVTFVVDFTHQGRAVRSRPRSVTFGPGAGFARPQYSFNVEEAGGRGFVVRVRGRDPASIPGDNFLHGWFTEMLTVGYAPQPGGAKGGEILLVVSNPQEVPDSGCVGWLQMFDETSGSYDRTLIHLVRAKPR